jgi:hypothetical protein
MPEDTFTYRRAGAAIMIFWRGREVKTMRGAPAAALLHKLDAADEDEQQALLARATGNFKRGTDRR